MFNRLAIVFACLFLLSAVSSAETELPILKVGHVGHDHQIALYVAADAGQSIEKDYGVYLKEIKHQEVYDLYEGGKPIARVILVRVGGGAKMPAAIEQGHIEIGLGGLGPVAKFVEKGSPIKILMPLNNDGDSLVMKKGMKINSWADFVKFVRASSKPVRIGYKDPMANAYMIFTSALREEKITYGSEHLGSDGKQVKIIMYNLQELDYALTALEGGIVEGVVVNEPSGTMLAHKGVGNIAADLSDLPPKGKWRNHPCCVLAASMITVREKRPIVKAFLKIIVAGTELIAKDKKIGAKSASDWTKTSIDIESKSILNVDYLSYPDASWSTGVNTWIEMMTTTGAFKDRFKGKKTDAIYNELVDTEIIIEAYGELPGRGKGGGHK